jgi:CelD/BcsL family acetyltransferase involved in cellulose biosynthesis
VLFAEARAMPALSLLPSPIDTACLARLPGGAPVRYTAREAISFTAASLTLEFVDNRLAFDALETEWCALFERAGRPEQVFQSFGWLWHWCNHFLDPHTRNQSLAVVTGRRNGTLVLACPFIVTRARGLATLTFMGDPVRQYGDVVIEDGPDAASDLRAAFDYLLREANADLVHLRKVRADAAIAPLMRELGAAVSDVQQAPYVAFNGATDYAVFEQRYAKSARKNRKRQLRRLHELGDLAFARPSPGQEAREAAAAALKLKRNWLRERGLVSAAVTDVRTQDFFRDCVSGDGPSTGVNIAVIKSNGDVAAAEISVHCKGHVAVHLIAYDARFEKTGAGALLMEDSVRRACHTGKSVVDLLAPGADYKFEWADRAIDVTDWVLGRSAAGRLFGSVYVCRIRPAAKALMERLPPVVRRRLSMFTGAGALSH